MRKSESLQVHRLKAQWYPGLSIAHINSCYVAVQKYASSLDLLQSQAQAPEKITHTAHRQWRLLFAGFCL